MSIKLTVRYCVGTRHELVAYFGCGVHQLQRMAGAERYAGELQICCTTTLTSSAQTFMYAVLRLYMCSAGVQLPLLDVPHMRSHLDGFSCKCVDCHI